MNLCINCGKEILKSNKKYCSRHCAATDTDVVNKENKSRIETCLKKYGVEHHKKFIWNR